MKIGIYVESSGFSTLAVNDLLIAQLAAVDQKESRARSENIKFGIRHRMKSGKVILNHSQFLGYMKGPDGKLKIVPEEAKTVCKIQDI